jgi:AraC-like DNA-binding protein
MITKRRDIAVLQEARQYIEDNYRKEIRVDSLCRTFGINRTKLQEGFGQLFGVSVHSHLLQLRMQKARELLLETDDSVKSIAIEVGYRSISSFTRLFTRMHGAPPTQFRSEQLTTGKLSREMGRSDK